MVRIHHGPPASPTFSGQRPGYAARGGAFEMRGASGSGGAVRIHHGPPASPTSSAQRPGVRGARRRVRDAWRVRIGRRGSNPSRPTGSWPSLWFFSHSWGCSFVTAGGICSLPRVRGRVGVGAIGRHAISRAPAARAPVPTFPRTRGKEQGAGKEQGGSRAWVRQPLAGYHRPIGCCWLDRRRAAARSRCVARPDREARFESITAHRIPALLVVLLPFAGMFVRDSGRDLLPPPRAGEGWGGGNRSPSHFTRAYGARPHPDLPPHAGEGARSGKEQGGSRAWVRQLPCRLSQADWLLLVG